VSQKRIERPQEKKPRPQDDTGPKTDIDINTGEVDDILQEIDIVEHPEKYTEEQRGCGCMQPPKKSGFR
jgi:hypothetical protein